MPTFYTFNPSFPTGPVLSFVSAALLSLILALPTGTMRLDIRQTRYFDVEFTELLFAKEQEEPDQLSALTVLSTYERTLPCRQSLYSGAVCIYQTTDGSRNS